MCLYWEQSMTKAAPQYLKPRWSRRILLDGLGRWWRWPSTLVYFASVLWMAWLASPHYVFRIMGAPDVTRVPSYTGTVRLDDSLQRSFMGWSATRYYIQTQKGEKEFFCGYLPKRVECLFFFRGPQEGSIYKVYFHEYFGATYVEYPADHKKRKLQSNPNEMAWYFRDGANDHKKYANYLLGMLLIYLVALGIYTLHDD